MQTVTLEGYDYLGLGAVVRRSHANGVDQSFIKLSGESVGDAGDQYTGLDRFGRVVRLRWLNGSTATDDFSYTYDRDGNRLTKDNNLHTAFNETYAYDKLNQLESFAMGSHTQEWEFDGLGNFTKVTTDGVDEDRTHDRQNRLTVMGSSSLGYDDNGNLTSIDSETDFTYDAWNRQHDVTHEEMIGDRAYEYDPLGRRIIVNSTDFTVSLPGPAGVDELYYSTSWQVVEEHRLYYVADEGIGGKYHLESQLVAQNVWSPVYVDALIERDRDTDENQTLDERLWAQQDANWNVTCIANNSGTVVERFVYDPYGAFTVYSSSWSSPSTDYAWVYLHQGGRWDAATELYNFRNRDYSPRLMRWVEQDPIGFAGHDSNLFRYVADNPLTHTDSFGLDMYPSFRDAAARAAAKKAARERAEWVSDPARLQAVKDRNAALLEKLDKLKCCPKEKMERAKELLTKVLDGSDFYWTRLTGFFGVCGAWSQEYESRNSSLINKVQHEVPECFKVDTINWENRHPVSDFFFSEEEGAPFPGLIPFLTFNYLGTDRPGHSAIRISFCDGTFYYLDDGNYGGPAHGFESIPDYYQYESSLHGKDPYGKCKK